MTAPCIEQMNANSTHIPILAGMIINTIGPVLELGVGHYSTPMLHYMCKDIRTIVSVESDKEWFEWFRSQFMSERHYFVHQSGKLFSKQYDKDCAIAFVDCSPEQERRDCVINLRDKARYIVVHDAEPQATIYQWNGLFDTFKHKYYWDHYGNGTVVVSDFQEIPL